MVLKAGDTAEVLPHVGRTCSLTGLTGLVKSVDKTTATMVSCDASLKKRSRERCRRSHCCGLVHTAREAQNTCVQPASQRVFCQVTSQAKAKCLCVLTVKTTHTRHTLSTHIVAFSCMCLQMCGNRSEIVNLVHLRKVVPARGPPPVTVTSNVHANSAGESRGGYDSGSGGAASGSSGLARASGGSAGGNDAAGVAGTGEHAVNHRGGGGGGSSGGDSRGGGGAGSSIAGGNAAAAAVSSGRRAAPDLSDEAEVGS
jgi:hypothetical protein